jgi:hypothetical protein
MDLRKRFNVFSKKVKIGGKRGGIDGFASGD